MARWYERANELAFKAVPGGFVFQCPNPWVFARPRYYLVNEAQKAEILGHLRRWRIANLAMIGFLVVTAIAVMLVVQIVPLSYSLPLIYAWAALIIVLCVSLSPHLYRGWKLAPIVATLPPTDQRIRMAEQLSSTATSAAKLLLFVGLVGGVVMVVAGVIGVIDAVNEGRSLLSIGSKVFTTLFGGLLALWFRQSPRGEEKAREESGLIQLRRRQPLHGGKRCTCTCCSEIDRVMNTETSGAVVVRPRGEFHRRMGEVLHELHQHRAAASGHVEENPSPAARSVPRSAIEGLHGARQEIVPDHRRVFGQDEAGNAVTVLGLRRPKPVF